ncbi:MAG: hypothetical protein ACNYPH_01685 [Gammaproteobacteria bacterium WSBS_2016_MAG_OTU1]
MILRAISFLLLLLSLFLAMAAGGTVEVPEAFAWVIVIGAVIASVGAVIASIASIGGWVSEVRDRGEKEGRTSERLGNVDKRLDNVEKSVDNLGKKVDDLISAIISGDLSAISSNSPLLINKDGQEIAQK